MEKLKENKKIVIPLILVALIFILGAAYAWLTTVLNGTQINRIKAGTLDLVLDDNASNGIDLEYAVPQTDTQGLNNQAYTFKVINNGTMNAKYNIYLEDEELESGEERINDTNVKYNLVKNSGENDPKLLSTTLDEENKRVLANNVIINGGGSEDNYSLKLWIDSEATKEEVANKVFKAKIKIEAVQTEESSVPAANENIKAVYRYNQNGTGTGLAYTGCLGGEEAGCSDVISEIDGESTYNAGDIVKYEVAPGVEKYFNVLYDNGDTLTMQQRENTIYSTAWYAGSNDNTKGPTTVLAALEAATASWTNVNDQTYTARTTEFGTGTFKTANTACTWTEGATVNAAQCSGNTYPAFTKTNVKARMITANEAGDMDCRMYKSDGSANMSCKKFMNNYLYQSTTYGGTVEDDYHTGSDHNYGYWTMSADLSHSTNTLTVGHNGRVRSFNTSDLSDGARAVVVVNK